MCVCVCVRVRRRGVFVYYTWCHVFWLTPAKLWILSHWLIRQRSLYLCLCFKEWVDSAAFELVRSEDVTLASDSYFASKMYHILGRQTASKAISGAARTRLSQNRVLLEFQGCLILFPVSTPDTEPCGKSWPTDSLSFQNLPFKSNDWQENLCKFCVNVPMAKTSAALWREHKWSLAHMEECFRLRLFYLHGLAF